MPNGKTLEHREPAVGRRGLGLTMALGEISLQVVFLSRLQRQPVMGKEPGGVEGQIQAVSRQSVGGQAILQPERFGKSVDDALAGLEHGL